MPSCTPMLLMRTWCEVRNFAWHRLHSCFQKSLRLRPEFTPTLRLLTPVHQRWPESLFQTPTPLLFQNFGILVRIWVLQFFKFENPTPVQTPATIINPTLIYPCFCLRNDHTDSCCCWNWKVTPGPVLPKFLTLGPDPGPKEKHRILPEATPVIMSGPTSATAGTPKMYVL